MYIAPGREQMLLVKGVEIKAGQGSNLSQWRSRDVPPESGAISPCTPHELGIIKRGKRAPLV